MSRRSRTYASPTHPALAGSGWWGAPWGRNLPNIAERVVGHGCATCCSYLNQCKRCTQAVETAAKDAEELRRSGKLTHRCSPKVTQAF